MVVNPIDNAGGNVQAGSEIQPHAARHEGVGVTACLTENANRHLQPGSRKQPPLHGELHARRGQASVAHHC